MSVNGITLPRLRQLIGRDVIHRGIRCRVLEVLEEKPALVLLDNEQNIANQDNQFGDPGRRVPKTYTVYVMSGDGMGMNPDFSALLASLGD